MQNCKEQYLTWKKNNPQCAPDGKYLSTNNVACYKEVQIVQTVLMILQKAGLNPGRLPSRGPSDFAPARSLDPGEIKEKGCEGSERVTAQRKG